MYMYTCVCIQIKIATAHRAIPGNGLPLVIQFMITNINNETANSKHKRNALSNIGHTNLFDIALTHRHMLTSKHQRMTNYQVLDANTNQVITHEKH